MPLSKRSKLSVVFSLFALVAIISGLLITGIVQRSNSVHAAGNQIIRQVSSYGTNTITSAPAGKDVGVQAPEISNALVGLGHASVRSFKNGVNRSLSSSSNSSQSAQGATTITSGPELQASFDGINHRQQRLANSGNQFSLEPPDQGLCVGNGFVLETVNDALNVYSSTGNSLLGVTALNAFYGYAPAINRTTGVIGPEVFDPGCYFDQPTQRWFHLAATLDVDSAGNFTGTNHLDIAVSQTSSPLGTWKFYHIPDQDNGTDGTPDHKCSFGFCFGDYPHLGADANGFYITTNEYSFFGPEFHAAQIYAFSKQALAANASTITFVQLDTVGLVGSPGGGFPGNPGFTVWPATSPDSQYATANNGTEYFLSSDAAAEANGNGASRDLVVWTLANTASLGTTPAPSLSNVVLTVNPYSIPPKSLQKRGSTPLIKCLNTSACATILLGGPDPFTEAEGPLDSNDTRMQQVTFAAGKLWGALDTTLTVNNVNEAGIEWFAVNPATSRVVKQGYLGGINANVIYPAIGVTTTGKGIMAFSLVGPNNFPSSAYASIDAVNGVGPIHIAANGLGPQDGFSETRVFSPFGNGVPRPRWGDYGAAVPVGNTVWIASEYIGQTCTFRQYTTNTTASPLFSCNMTRTTLANWDTRISRVEV